MIKKLIPYVLLAICILYIFLQRGCNNKESVQNTKLVTQYDTIIKPVALPSKTITLYKTLKGDTIYLKGKTDTIKIKEFEKANDSVKLNMFAECNKIRQYKNEFNDSVADVSIFTETRGELLKIAPKVTIKAKLPQKKTVFAIYTGIDLYNNKSLNNFGVKANLFFQNKKGDLFTLSYDTNKNIYLGYNFRILNITK